MFIGDFNAKCKPQSPIARDKLPGLLRPGRGEAPQLWIYHSENGKASPVPVEIGPVIGGEVELIDGVGFGQRIIIAGADQLDESMELYEMLKVEQAN